MAAVLSNVELCAGPGFEQELELGEALDILGEVGGVVWMKIRGKGRRQTVAGRVNRTRTKCGVRVFVGGKRVYRYYSRFIPAGALAHCYDHLFREIHGRYPVRNPDWWKR